MQFKTYFYKFFNLAKKLVTLVQLFQSNLKELKRKQTDNRKNNVVRNQKHEKDAVLVNINVDDCPFVCP